MTRKWRMALACMVLAAGTQAVSAEDATPVGDLRCLVIAMQLADNADESIQQTGQWTALYYLGRLDAKGANPDLQAAILAEARKLTPEEAAKDGQTCGDPIEARMKILSATDAAMALDQTFKH